MTDRSDELKRRIARAVEAGSFRSGRPIGLLSKQRLERMLGRPLPEVSIHDTEPAGVLADALQARAFTVGRHMFLPHSATLAHFAEDRGLLAHEMVHATQSAPSFPPGPPVGVTSGEKPIVRMASPSGTATSEHRMEREAASAEQEAMAHHDDSPRNDDSDRPDPALIADRVYRLIANELSLNRERSPERVLGR